MILYPNVHLKSVLEITIEFLHKNQINALILDVDNTLIDYDKNLQLEIIEWAKNLKANNIKLYILSNTNKHEKVKEVAKKLQVEYIYFAKKPLKTGFKKVQKVLNEEPENIGVVGDQIFTDVVGGNRCNMFTILVEPIAEKDIWITLIKRPIENAIKKRYIQKQEQKYKVGNK